MTVVRRDFEKREVRRQIEQLIDAAIQANVRETTRLSSRPLVTLSDLLLMAVIIFAAFLFVATLRT